MGRVPAHLQQHLGLSEFKKVTCIRFCSRYWSFAEEMMVEVIASIKGLQGS